MSENSAQDYFQEIMSPGSLKIKSEIQEIVDELKKTNDVLDKIIADQERMEQDIIILKEGSNG